MNSPPTPRASVRFGEFEFVPAQRSLERGGVRIELSSRAIEILAVLTERPGEVVTKRELMERVWPDTLVVEAALRFHMVALRKALGDGAGGGRSITTVPGRGYCFVAGLQPGPAMAEADDSSISSGSRPLPALSARVVGRDAAVEELLSRLELQRFVTVVGPGGIGKTTAALTVAHRWAAEHGDTAVFVDLGDVAPDDEDGVAEALCATLGAGPQASSPMERALAQLQTSQALVVLDTCEGVIEAAARVAETLVATAPGVWVLATSRESLRAEGEFVYRIKPLPAPAADVELTAQAALAYPAVQLFAQRAAAHHAGFELSDEHASIAAAICRELDGMPLAIELAAGRVEAFGIQQVADLLATEFALTWPGRRTATPRQQTLRATLNWSHELLGPVERAVFRRLSVLAGAAFSLEAAMAVCGDDQTPRAEVAEALFSLVAKSLLRTVTDDFRTRYRLLDIARAYARGKLDASSEEADARQRQARFYMEALNRQAPAHEDHAATSECVANVRAVLAWAFATEGMDALAIELSAAAADLWLHEGLLSDSRRWARQALARLDDGAAAPSELEARIRLASSIIYTHGITAESEHHGQVAYEQARHEDRAELRLEALYVVWAQQVRLARYAAAQRLLDESGFADGDADPATTPVFHWMVATTARFLGDHSAVRRHAEQILGEVTQPASDLTHRLLGSDLEGAAGRLLTLADFFSGDIDSALARGEQDLVRVGGLTNPAPRANILYWQAFLAYQLEDYDDVDRRTTIVLESAKSSMSRPQPGVAGLLYADGAATAMQGLLHIRRGEPARGREMVEEGLKICAEADYHILDAFIRAELALQLARQGLSLASPGTAMVEASGEETWFTPEALRIEGEIAECEGQPEVAEVRYLEALDVTERHGALIWRLRAATSLASLWAGQGRAAEAEALLAPVYRQFDSGSERPVLSHAAACLENCRRARVSASSV